MSNTWLNLARANHVVTSTICSDLPVTLALGPSQLSWCFDPSTEIGGTCQISGAQNTMMNQDTAASPAFSAWEGFASLEAASSSWLPSAAAASAATCEISRTSALLRAYVWQHGTDMEHGGAKQENLSTFSVYVGEKMYAGQTKVIMIRKTL